MVVLKQGSKIRIEHFFIAILIVALGFFMLAKDPKRAIAVNDISSCGTISISGNYQLVNDISAVGTCIQIAGNNIVLDGNGFGITGDVVGSSNDPANAAYVFTLRNIVVNGSVYSNGANGDNTHQGSNAGNITLYNVTANAVQAKGGDGYNGGQGADEMTGENASQGGNGGVIDITNSTVASVDVSGGAGGNGGKGGNGVQSNGSFAATGGQGGNGGAGGTIQFAHSTSTESLYATGGAGGRGGEGGTGYTGLDGANGNFSGGASGTFGGQGGVGGPGAVSGMGGLITISDKSYVTSGAYVQGGNGGQGGQGGSGGNGGAGGAADLDFASGGEGGSGGQGGKGGDGASGAHGGVINVYESFVYSVNAYGGAPGPYGSGGAGGTGGNGGPQNLANGEGGAGGTGGNGGNTGDNFGMPTEHGGTVTLRNARVNNVSHFGGQPPSAGVPGTGGAGGQGGNGPTVGVEGTAGMSGSDVGNSTNIGADGTLSLSDEPPYQITLNGSSTVQITQGTTFTDPGAYGYDLRDGFITATVTGSVNISTPGNYTLTYTVTDQGSAPVVNGTTQPEYTIAPHSTTTTRTVVVVAAPAAPAATNTPAQSPVAPQSASGGTTSFGDAGGQNFGNQNVNNNQGPNLAQLNINENAPAPIVRAQIQQKIDQIFGDGKDAIDILLLLGKKEVKQLVKKQIDIEDIKPFNKALEENLKVIGASSCPAFTKNILPGRKDNDPAEVKKWQRFYNALFGADLEVNGIYNNATLAETYRFQKVFTSIVLSPWGANDPTGNISITTRLAANGILGCPLEAKK